MLALLTDPAAWASFLTLTVLEIVLGIDNIIFLSIVSERLPPHQRRRARMLGLSLALLMRVALLFSIVWLTRLTAPILHLGEFGLSWRDIILIAGGLFLLWKAATEIFAEVEGTHMPSAGAAVVHATFAATIVQIVILDLVFSLDSVITAVGIADQIPIMVGAIIVAIILMMVASEPISGFVSRNPSTKMLALAFLFMVGMALVADGFHQHIDRGFIYAAMAFAGAVEALNLWRYKRNGVHAAGSPAEDPAAAAGAGGAQPRE